MDSGCDQSIINSNSFVVLSITGRKFYVDGALQSRMTSSSALEVVNGATVLQLSNTKIYLLIVNQALLDTHPSQREALLQPHQARAHGTIVEDCAHIHMDKDGRPGGQFVKTPDSPSLPLYFDGWKCYFSIWLPTKEELSTLPRIELTSPSLYEPSRRLHTRRVSPSSRQQEVSLDEWRSRLGYAPEEVVKHTIKGCTNLVTTVEAESRTYMRDHIKARLLPLRPLRINDTAYTDTFFSSVTSCRGFKCWQLYGFVVAQFDKIYLMKNKGQAPTTLQDLICEIGAPNFLINDNSKEQTSDAWLTICRQFCIATHTTEPHHPNQNIAEHRGGDLKTALLILFHHTPHAPLRYW